MTRRLPPQASVAEPAGGAMLHAPAADRNAGIIADLLCEVAPRSGTALELASGTGQHVVHFARALPGLHWHPTDVEDARLASIAARAKASGLTNIAAPERLDAAVPGWSAGRSADLIVLVNLLHLISDAEARTVLTGSAQALAPDGGFTLYGPFRRAGELTSEGDRSFDAALSASDPAIGYKDDFDMMDILQEAGLEMSLVLEMPANNLALVARKPA
jgi:hypothetical protein